MRVQFFFSLHLVNRYCRSITEDVAYSKARIKPRFQTAYYTCVHCEASSSLPIFFFFLIVYPLVNNAKKSGQSMFPAKSLLEWYASKHWTRRGFEINNVHEGSVRRSEVSRARSVQTKRKHIRRTVSDLDLRFDRFYEPHRTRRRAV